jgi:hypothetical protein
MKEVPMPEDTQQRYDRRTGPGDRNLRVGDQERDVVSEILRREHVNGRLDVSEFQERLEQCLTAKTYADLDKLVADLPGAAATRTRRTRAWRRPWPLAFLPVVVIAAIVMSGGRVLWLAFPLFWLFLLRTFVWRSWGRGYGGYGRW